MNFKKSAWLAIAAAIAFVGIFLAVRGVAVATRRTPPTRPPVADRAAAAALDAIKEFEEPVSAEQCSVLAAQVSARTIEQLPASIAGRGEMGDALRTIVFERVRLMLDPSYDAYVAHVGGVLGRDGTAVLSGGMFADPALWNAFARIFRFAGVAPEAVTARVFESAEELDDLQGGRRVTLGDPGFYGSAPLIAHRAPMAEVAIPMMLAPDGDRPGLLVVIVSMCFVWDAFHARWIPVLTGVHDPTGLHQGLPALWI